MFYTYWYMKVLGIDQSYTSTGYCVLDENLKIQTCGLFKSSRNDDIFDRARTIAICIKTLCDETEPAKIAIEGLAFGSRGNFTRDLAGLQFVIVATLRNFGYTKHLEIVGPPTLKKFATKKGNAKKEEMYENLPDEIKQQFQEYKKTKGRSDITDAYWLARYLIK